MKFTREEVLSIIDEIFHEWASSYRIDGKESAITIMNRYEKEKNNKKLQSSSIEADIKF